MSRPFHLYHFPPLARTGPESLLQLGDSAAVQKSLEDGFKQGMEAGFAQGYEQGVTTGRDEGFRQGHNEGSALGRNEGHEEGRAKFEEAAAPLDELFQQIENAFADYQTVLRKDAVSLVERVARQVIRCELALQPVQLLSLVNETLAAMPPVESGDIKVFLSPTEYQRIVDLAPEQASRWRLISDPGLAPGECRVKTDRAEADAGCEHRLEACIEQLETQLVDSAPARKTTTRKAPAKKAAAKKVAVKEDEAEAPPETDSKDDVVYAE